MPIHVQCCHAQVRAPQRQHRRPLEGFAQQRARASSECRSAFRPSQKGLPLGAIHGQRRDGVGRLARCSLCAALCLEAALHVRRGGDDEGGGPGEVPRRQVRTKACLARHAAKLQVLHLTSLSLAGVGMCGACASCSCLAEHCQALRPQQQRPKLQTPPAEPSSAPCQGVRRAWIPGKRTSTRAMPRMCSTGRYVT
jgi:hypothetical protein